MTMVSTATKNELLKYAKIDPLKIHIIYVPISPLFKACKKQFNKQEPVILQVGTKLNKNVVRLVQALRGIKCKLEIVGKVDDVLLRELRINNVKFDSYINLTDGEIVEKYGQADIIAFVSTYEGFGMPIVEGNAVGRVVVTSNIVSMPEVAGNAAHLVNPFDVKSIHAGIIKVIEDDHYREKLIANGFINRKRFESSTIANQYYEVYKSLVPK